MRRVSSVEGKGSIQSLGVFVSPMSPGSSAGVVERRVSIEASVVWGCDPVFAVTRTRSDKLWRAAPPFAASRIASCMSLHAALCRLMVSALWDGHSPTMCVQESGLWHSGHSSVDAWPYSFARLPLCNWPYTNFRRIVSSQGLGKKMLCMDLFTVMMWAPHSLLGRMRRL